LFSRREYRFFSFIQYPGEKKIARPDSRHPPGEINKPPTRRELERISKERRRIKDKKRWRKKQVEREEVHLHLVVFHPTFAGE
jgi:hypothetical protein